MGEYVVSLVSIAKASDKPSSEALGVGMGHSGNEFRVALTDNPQLDEFGEPLLTPILDEFGDPVPGEFGDPIPVVTTHYGLHSWTTLTRKNWWKGNTRPLNTGYTRAQIDAIRNKLTISTRDSTTNPKEHFDDILTANGLTRIEV